MKSKLFISSAHFTVKSNNDINLKDELSVTGPITSPPGAILFIDTKTE